MPSPQIIAKTRRACSHLSLCMMCVFERYAFLSCARPHPLEMNAHNKRETRLFSIDTLRSYSCSNAMLFSLVPGNILPRFSPTHKHDSPSIGPVWYSRFERLYTLLFCARCAPRSSQHKTRVFLDRYNSCTA